MQLKAPASALLAALFATGCANAPTTAAIPTSGKPAPTLAAAAFPDKATADSARYALLSEVPVCDGTTTTQSTQSTQSTSSTVKNPA